MPRSNTAEDFWAKINGGALDECWEWQGARSDRGYGKTHYQGKEWRAHRLAFILFHGSFPKAVCHTCDNPACCNPMHLFAGTNGSNNKDRAKKGRSHKPKGEAHPSAKLTEADVIAIRSTYGAGGISQSALGMHYGITQSAVKDICLRKRWAHVA